MFELSDLLRLPQPPPPCELQQPPMLPFRATLPPSLLHYFARARAHRPPTMDAGGGAPVLRPATPIPSHPTTTPPLPTTMDSHRQPRARTHITPSDGAPEPPRSTLPSGGQASPPHSPPSFPTTHDATYSYSTTQTRFHSGFGHI